MIRLFDSHADTPYELWIRKEKLVENTCHIDSKKAAPFEEYRQVFAFCSLAGSKWEITREQFLDCQRYFLETLEGQTFVKPHLSIEGPEVINCDPELLSDLANRGFVMSTLTWNYDNSLAGFHKSDKGLTDRGAAYVEAAGECGILIDVSHLCEKAFWDLAEVTKAPILASHSNCRSIWDHTRNLTDDQLHVIAQTGGLVGLNLYVPFLGKEADFETLLRHLEHMLKHCGENRVCLGGDLDGCDVLPKGFSDLSSYVHFYEFLKGKGYSETLLDGLFYSNLASLIGRNG